MEICCYYWYLMHGPVLDQDLSIMLVCTEQKMPRETAATLGTTERTKYQTKLRLVLGSGKGIAYLRFTHTERQLLCAENSSG